MKIVLIGATGFVGNAILKEALQRGQQVTALARDTSKIRISDPNLTVKDQDVADVALATVIKGNDAVISAFNAGWGNPNLYEDFLTGSKEIEKAVEASGVKRLIVIGGAGSLEVNGHQLVDSDGFPEQFRAGASAARDYLNILKENQLLDWTFFSPAIEMGPHVQTGRTGKYRLGTDSPVFDNNGKSVLSVEDLAVVILDEAENGQHIRQRFTAGY
ncbi:histidine kinase [Niabella ginsenosidivorans]|uniref:Histidine kinase n=1 Tax=Niabella ginsenosidivorans TaxID=1176587 RepID=A0A1A9I0T2_9BACT|nr:NAD(P)H-binding protein [Niabella ginsenosidivorans]ANH81267.1 histidine kinase [Niabella ginsenosidivorans]